MAEETQVQEQVVETPSPFAQDGWTEQLPTVPEKVVETPTSQDTPANTATQTQVQEPVKEAEEILDPKDWLKREFEVDDPNVIKQYLKEYKELKEKPAEYSFANDESKRLAEAISKGDRKTILNILETQERLDRFTTSEVTDDTAADIIKLSMQLKYKDLSPQEIEYKYNKEFGLPKEPVYDELKETEDEFNARKEAWHERVNDIRMNRNIEAKLAKPELEKLKSQIVLPEIAKPENPQLANQPTEAELKHIRENFLKTLDSNYSKVEGFTTRVKDELVEYPVHFKIPDEDKVAIKERLTNEGLDVNAYMDKRWFDSNGNPNIEKIITDIYQLENFEKILSGVANKSASERWETYTKSTKNLNVTQTSTPSPTFQQNNNGNISPFAKDAWSDKVPIIQN